MLFLLFCMSGFCSDRLESPVLEGSSSSPLPLGSSAPGFERALLMDRILTATGPLADIPISFDGMSREELRVFRMRATEMAAYYINAFTRRLSSPLLITAQA